MRRALIAGAILLALSPAVAQEPQCFSIADVQDELTTLKGELLGIVDIPGIGVDQIVIWIVQGVIRQAPALGGCMVGDPVTLVQAKKASLGV